MTCRVFLVGEGPTDIGDLVELPGYRSGGEGFLQPILRQMVAGGVDLDFFDGRKLTELKRLTRRDAPHHLQTRKAAQALALASVLDADALVFACDLDKSHGAAKAVERRRRLREIRKSIEAGFAHARETDPEAARVLTAAAVPARMIEAWALADREALAELAGIDTASLDYRPPEELWGAEDDPTSNHPKCVWRRVTRDQLTHAEIGERARPHVLERACPESFVPFARDVKSALTRCRSTRAA
jgi:Domain of unknown function (DUF4276)